MDDVRRAAEERAKRPKTAPVGASFESERQRSKNALVKQLDSMDGRNVRKIAAVADAPQEEKILRVAAYCRVSTDDIDQAISIHLQIQEYKKKILANPNWKYVGTYVDDGFSGTNTEHRQGFQKLMKDAMDLFPLTRTILTGSFAPAQISEFLAGCFDSPFFWTPSVLGLV